MSGECGYHPLPVLRGPFNLNSQQVAKEAAATLGKLNSLMKQLNEWQEQRLTLESNIRSLKSALQSAGENPDEVLKPDPLLVHQREEIHRLKLTEVRLEEEICNLRAELLEAEQAITCSGAKKLKEKLTKMRDKAAEERRKFKDEIEYLKKRVQEAEDDSSCSAMSRLRKNLREILNGDKKFERIIADVATRTCDVVINLSVEVGKIEELLDQSNVEYIKLRRENRRLKAVVVESAPKGELPSGCTEHLQTIERLGFQVKELERKIKEFEDDSQLVKRVEELEETLNHNRKQFNDQENLVTSLQNEILGAKTAYKLICQELDGFEDAKRNIEKLNKELEERDEIVTNLKQQLSESTSIINDRNNLRTEIMKVRSKLLNLEIERDLLLEDIEKMRSIVSARNEQIEHILEENENREKARKAEIEDMKTKLSIALAENQKLSTGVNNMEEELAAGRLYSESSKMSEDSGDCTALKKKIKKLEEELVELKELLDPLKKDLADANAEVKTLKGEVNTLKGSKVKLEKELSDAVNRMDAVHAKLVLEQSAKEVALAKSKSLNKEKDELTSEKRNLQLDYDKLVKKFAEDLNKLKTKNLTLNYEINELKTRNLVLISENDDLKIKVEKLEHVLNQLSIEFNYLNVKEAQNKISTGKDNEITVNPSAAISMQKIEDKKRWLNQYSENFIKELDRSNPKYDTLEQGLELIEEGNATLEKEINKPKSKNTEIKDNTGSVTKTPYTSEEKLRKVEADNVASKTELQKMRAERDALKDEFKKLSSVNNALKKEVGDSCNEVIKLTAIKEEVEENLKLISDQLKVALKEIKSLKMNDVTKAELENLKLENEKLRMDIEKLLRTPKDQEQNPIHGNISKKTKGKVVMDCGDYVRADRELKYYIHLQSLAVKRVVDFISYIDGTTGVKPSMATFLEPTLTNVMVLNFDENIMSTFRMSQKLSEKIFTAEIGVQKLEALRTETNHLRAERDCLNNGMEKVTAMLNNFGQIISIPHYIQEEHGEHFDTEAKLWPRSQSSLQVLTSPSIPVKGRIEMNNQFLYEMGNSTIEISPLSEFKNADEKFFIIKNRISSLQNEIKLKQREAAERVCYFENIHNRLIVMRETMRQEQIGLMEIADRTNVPYITERNLNEHLQIDKSIF